MSSYSKSLMPLHSLLKISERKLILHLKNIFLAGGFAESQYLFNEVKRYADSTNIQVQRADDWLVDSLIKKKSLILTSIT
jgi:hypothetical protein